MLFGVLTGGKLMLSFKDLRIEIISLNTSCISVSKIFLAYRERQSSFALLDFSTLLSVALSLDDIDWCGFCDVL